MRIFIFSILISQISFAASNFAGSWVGKGLIESSREGNLPVDSVVFEFSERDLTLSSKDCWNFIFDSNPWRYCSHRDLEIQGPNVIYKGKKIGSFSENRIEVHFIEGTNQVDAVVQITNEGTLNYSYSSIEVSGQFLRQSAEGLKKIAN